MGETPVEHREDEVLPSRSAEGMLGRALINFLSGVNKTAERLAKKTKYEVENYGKKPRIKHYNMFLLTKRFNEFLVNSANKKESMRQFLLLAEKDFDTWANEYILHVDKDEFAYEVSTDPDGTTSLKTLEYQQTTLATMAENAVREFREMGEPTSRLEGDQIANARLMSWAGRPDAKDGDVAFSVSPFDKDNKFYRFYSFVFKRVLRILANGARIVQTTQYKSWHSHKHLSLILRDVGCNVPESSMSDKALAACFFPVAHNISDAEISTILKKYPNRRKIPKSMRAVELKNSEEFQKAMQTAKDFVMQVIREQYSHLLEKNTPENALIVSRILEEVIGSHSKRFLDERIKQDGEGVVDYGSKISVNTLYETSMAVIRHKYYKVPLTKKQASSLIATMTDVFGYLGPITSWGQCLGGTLPSLLIKGATSGSGQMFGITPELLGTHIVGQHMENCPICGIFRSVHDLANGDVWCPGCKQVKKCGVKPHIEEHSPAMNLKKPKVEHVPKSKPKASAPQLPTSAGDFFGSLLTGMLTGNTVTA